MKKADRAFTRGRPETKDLDNAPSQGKASI